MRCSLGRESRSRSRRMRRSVVALEGNESRQLIVLPAGTGDVKRMPRGSIVEYLDWAAWSPDGRRIYFAGRDATDVRRTYVQDMDGGEPRPVTPDGFVGMALSPDGRTVAAVDRYGEYYLCAMDERAEPRPLPGTRTEICPCSGARTAGRCSFAKTAT